MYDELTEVDIQKMKDEIDYRTRELRPKLIEEVKVARGFGDKTPSRPLRASRFARLLQTRVLPPPCRSAGYAVRRAWFCSRTSPDALPATVWHSHSDV